MNTKELMIGDLIQSDLGTIYRIKGVRDFEGGEVLVNTGKADIWYQCTLINPIPLTPEILEKNGFVKSTIEEDVYNFPNNNKALKERGFALDYHGYGRWFITDHNLMKILYVHQLQHALRLCGLDEIANNFTI
mgnify:CR=1 FL=1